MEDQLLAQFASPCKRRKACPDSAMAGFMSPPAKPAVPRAQAPDSKMCTPKTVKQLGFTAPATPGTNGFGSRLDFADGSLEQSSTSSTVLKDVLNALHITVPMVKSRGQLTTFNNLKQPIQNITGKTLRLQHLQQIKHLVPEAFSWQHVMATSGTSKRQEQQLVIHLPDRAAKGAAASSKEQLELLQQLLEEHAADSKGSTIIPLAALPPPASCRAGRDLTPSRHSAVEQPCTPQTSGPYQRPMQLSPNFSIGTPQAAGSAANSCFIFSPPARRPPTGNLPDFSPLGPFPNSSKQPGAAAASSLADSEPQGGGVKVRRLQFGVSQAKENEQQQQQQGPAKPAAGSSSGSKVVKGLTFEPGAAVLELLQEATKEENVQQAAARKEDLAFERQMTLLPATFDVLRAIYGDRGPCIKPKTELLTLMRQKSTCSSGLTEDDATQQLDLVVRLLPGWLVAVNAPGQGLAGLSASLCLRLDRRLGWSTARAKLLTAVEEARAGRAQARARVEQERREEERELEAATAAAADDDRAGEEQQREEGASAAMVVPEGGRAAAAAVAGGASGASGPGRSASTAASRKSRLSACSSSSSGAAAVGAGKGPVLGKRQAGSSVRQQLQPQRPAVSAAAAELLGVGPANAQPASKGSAGLLGCLAFKGSKKL